MRRRRAAARLLRDFFMMGMRCRFTSANEAWPCGGRTSRDGWTVISAACRRNGARQRQGPRQSRAPGSQLPVDGPRYFDFKPAAIAADLEPAATISAGQATGGGARAWAERHANSVRGAARNRAGKANRSGLGASPVPRAGGTARSPACMTQYAQCSWIPRVGASGPSESVRASLARTHLAPKLVQTSNQPFGAAGLTEWVTDGSNAPTTSARHAIHRMRCVLRCRRCIRRF